MWTKRDPYTINTKPRDLLRERRSVRCKATDKEGTKVSERDKGVIRMDAAMFALVAEMEAVKVRIEAMKVDNEIQQACGGGPAWNGPSFREMAGELEEIAKALRTEI